jgi:hypothetical protein
MNLAEILHLDGQYLSNIFLIPFSVTLLPCLKFMEHGIYFGKVLLVKSFGVFQKSVYYSAPQAFNRYHISSL